MSTRIYWITDTIGIMPRPRGNEWLEDEIIAFKKQGVDIIVSLLEASEIAELGLRQEKLVCEKHSIQFINFPIPDRSLPPKGQKTEVFIQSLKMPSKKIVIHCRMGIGRSAIIAASILLDQNKKATEIISHISHIRGLKVPDTEEQFQWLKEREKRLPKEKEKSLFKDREKLPPKEKENSLFKDTEKRLPNDRENLLPANHENLLYKPVHHLIQRQPLHNNREHNDDITSG